MRCAPAFSNGTPPTISTALTISRPQNRERKARICWHTIFICGKPQWYGKLLKQRGLLSRQADIRRGIDASRIAFLPAVLMRWSLYALRGRHNLKEHSPDPSSRFVMAAIAGIAVAGFNTLIPKEASLPPL